MSPRPMQHRRDSRSSTGAYSLEPDPDWNVYPNNRASHVGLASGLPQNIGGIGMRRGPGEYQVDADGIQLQWMSPKSHQQMPCLAQPPQELNRDDPLLNHTFYGCETAILSKDTAMVDFYEQANGVLTPDISPPTTASPLSERPWMPITSDQADPNQFFPKRIKLPVSLGANPPVQRSDGVRKKNAKFEIPTGRTIETIDGLIKNADNPDLVKELKVQKRLLKNREAALQSRQRKKQHTEVLEAEKTNYLKSIDDHRTEIDLLKAAKSALEAERAEWKLQKAEAEKRIAQLEADRVRDATVHSNEVSGLYKQISMLQDTLQNMQSNVQSGGTPISTVPSVTDYTGVTNLVSELPTDMSSITWNDAHHPGNAVWDNFMMDINVASGNPNDATDGSSQDHDQQQQSQHEHASTQAQLQQHIPKPKMKSDNHHSIDHYSDSNVVDGHNATSSQEALSKALMLIFMAGALTVVVSVEHPKTKSKQRGGFKAIASTALSSTSKTATTTITRNNSILQNLALLSNETKVIARKILTTLFAHAGLLLPPYVDTSSSISMPESSSSSGPEVQVEINKFLHLVNSSWGSVLNNAVREFDAMIRSGSIIEIQQPVQLHQHQQQQQQQQQQQRQNADAIVEQDLFISNTGTDG